METVENRKGTRERKTFFFIIFINLEKAYSSELRGILESDGGVGSKVVPGKLCKEWSIV